MRNRSRGLAMRGRALRGGGGAAPSTLLNDLVAYWKLDEASGDRADSVGSSTAADNNTVTSDTGKVGTAASFAAANTEYLRVTDNATISLGADTPFTLAAWVKMADPTANPDTNAAIFSKGGGGDSNEYILVITNIRTAQLFVANGAANTSLQSNVTITDGAWNLVVAWHDPDADTLNVQINNETPESGAWSGGTQDGANDLYIGALSGVTYRMDGQLDELGIWKRVLTADERAALYNGGAGTTYPF